MVLEGRAPAVARALGLLAHAWKREIAHPTDPTEGALPLFSGLHA